MPSETISPPGDLRIAMGSLLYNDLRRRVIDHAVDVMMLGGELIPVEGSHGDVVGFTLRYPENLGHEIVVAARTRLNGVLRDEDGR